MKFVLFILLIAVIAGWLYLRQNRKKEPADPVAERRIKNSSTEYHAVSIRFSKQACSAAKELSGRRFLSADAPGLPLAECDVAKCDCLFKHHSDRRSSEPRRSPLGSARFGGATGRFERERRENAGRRDEID
jgi:hypothetical protein